jgi:hypothetical protein
VWLVARFQRVVKMIGIKKQAILKQQDGMHASLQ